jgi:hypothetical protein
LRISSLAKPIRLVHQGNIMTINEAIARGNPYQHPIVDLLTQLGEMKWRFPFFTQALVFFASCVVLVMLVVLYLTVGLIAQVSSIFSYLIQDARQDMRGRSTIEKTGYIVAIGVYFLIWAPLWIIQLPLFLVGWIWETFGYFTLLLLIVLAAAWWYYGAPALGPSSLTRWLNWAREAAQTILR